MNPEDLQIPQGTIVQTQVVCQLNDQIGMNVVYHRCDAAPIGGGTDMRRFADAINLRIADPIKSCLVSSAFFLGIRCQIVFPLLLPGVIRTNLAGAGSIAGEPLPRQTSGIISKKSTQAGQRKGGRTYIPFPSEGSNDVTARPNAVYLANAAAYADAICLPFNVVGGPGTSNMIAIIFRRSAPGASSDVRAYTVAQAWATQRRRGSFGRQNVNPLV